MYSKKTIKNKFGYFELASKPNARDLQIYYAEKYFQEAQGSYEINYSPAEKLYFHNKVMQKHVWATTEIKYPSTRNPRFLDVGAGEGWALAYFNEAGWDCKGLDYSSHGCSSQNNEVSNLLIIGDIYEKINELLTEGAKFDLILLDNLLEHVLDPYDLLQKLLGLVGDTGGLIVEVPNDFSVLQEHLLDREHISAPFWIAPPDHISYFNKDGLAELARGAGWDVKDIISDYPIDFCLTNPLTNYVRDATLGKPCHNARVEMENLLHKISPQKTIEFYRSLASLGLGRELLALLTPSQTHG